MMGWPDGSWWILAVWLPLCVAVVAVLVAALAATLTQLRPQRARDPMECARRVLDERYAAGELDDAEYRRRSEVLGGR